MKYSSKRSQRRQVEAGQIENWVFLRNLKDNNVLKNLLLYASPTAVDNIQARVRLHLHFNLWIESLKIETFKSKAKVKYNFKIRIRMPPELCRTCKITQTKLTKENCDKRKCCPKAFCSDYRVAFLAKGFLTQADRKWPGDQCTVVWIICTRT